MTSVVAPPRLHLQTPSSALAGSNMMTSLRDVKREAGPDEEMERGRRRQRSADRKVEADDDMDGEEGKAGSSNSDGPARKRRRSRKALDKKFECSTEGCGKSYSRAEHL